MTFPERISELLSTTDKTPDTNSGSEVPMPTIKIPTTNVGNLKKLPMVDAASVKKFELMISTASAVTKMIISIHIVWKI